MCESEASQHDGSVYCVYHSTRYRGSLRCVEVCGLGFMSVLDTSSRRSICSCLNGLTSFTSKAKGTTVISTAVSSPYKCRSRTQDTITRILKYIKWSFAGYGRRVWHLYRPLRRPRSHWTQYVTWPEKVRSLSSTAPIFSSHYHKRWDSLCRAWSPQHCHFLRVCKRSCGTHMENSVLPNV